MHIYIYIYIYAWPERLIRCCAWVYTWREIRSSLVFEKASATAGDGCNCANAQFADSFCHYVNHYVNSLINAFCL